MIKTGWHFTRARFLLFFNRRDAAMDAFRAVLALEPDNTLALGALGFFHGEKGETTQAIQCFQRVLALTPNDANTMFNLGFILQKNERHDDAIAQFDAALKINPKIDRAWFGRGMSLASQKRHEEAIIAFERAARLQPMNPHPLQELGLQHHALGRPDEVEKVIARLREFDPKATEALIKATS